MSNSVNWVAVDWGTSNLRAWGIGADGAVVFERSSEKGMGKLSKEEFAPALLELVGHEGDQQPDLEIVVCGMAGAKQGWLEAPYVEAPADLGALYQNAVHPEVSGTKLKVSILPGVCQRGGDENVMRGEETQLLGLASVREGYAGIVCMPGTHSKWAKLNGTRIEHFSTAMTGEMFEVLRTHSVLRHSLNGALDGPERSDGFLAGATDGLERPEQLLGMLFRVRAGSLLSGRQPAWCAGYLSGLLIGTEIASNRHLIGDAAVPLIGSPVLCELYRQVLGMIGARGEPQDATQIVLAGLKAARGFAA